MEQIITNLLVADNLVIQKVRKIAFSTLCVEFVGSKHVFWAVCNRFSLNISYVWGYAVQAVYKIEHIAAIARQLFGYQRISTDKYMTLKIGTQPQRHSPHASFLVYF